MWQSGWQGGANDGNQPQSATQHPAGNQQDEHFSDMFRMLDQPGQEFNDLSGMFQTFTE